MEGPFPHQVLSWDCLWVSFVSFPSREQLFCSLLVPFGAKMLSPSVRLIFSFSVFFVASPFWSLHLLFGMPPQLGSDYLLGYRGTLQGGARRDRLVHGMRVWLGCSGWHQSSLDHGGCYCGHEGTNCVFLCDCTGGGFLLVQNHDDVLCHKHQTVIV
jgi:hypothetical protein